MIKIIIIINLAANDHDSGDDDDEIQVQDQEESCTINTSHDDMSSSSMTSMDLSKNKTDKPMQPVIKYPQTKFGSTTGIKRWFNIYGSTNRSFQSRWYRQTIPVVRIFHQF